MGEMLISSKPLVCEKSTNHRVAKWLISVLGEKDENNRIIPEEAGEKCYKSIIGYPVVARLLTDMFGNPVDFADHSITKKKDKEGNVTYRYNTMPIGSITDSEIEEMEINGETKKCIVVSSKLWSDRFPEYFKVLDSLWENGRVKSSWELDVATYEYNEEGVKILKDFEFVGNCILGSKVLGAVPEAGMLEYASVSEEDDIDEVELALASALSQDIKNDKDKEVGEKAMDEEVKNLEQSQSDSQKNEGETKEEANKAEEASKTAEPETSTESATKEEEPKAEPEVKEEAAKEDGTEGKEVSSLTSNDIERKLDMLVNKEYEKYGYISYLFPEEHYALCRMWNMNELSYNKVNYSVNGDEVSIDSVEPVTLAVTVKDINTVVAQKEDTIVALNTENIELKKQVASLEKDSVELAEIKKEKAEAELKAKQEEIASYVANSNMFSAEEIESEEVKLAIASVDYSTIKSMIADKVIAEKASEAEKAKELEVSEKLNLEAASSGFGFNVKAFISR